MALFYQNATFVPLVILTEMWGADSAIVVKLFFFVVFFSAFLFTTYGLFFGGAARKPELGKVLHPVLLVTAAAILTRLAGLEGCVPGFVLRALEMVGQMTVPLLMLILGGSIYLDVRQGTGLQLVEVAKFVALKNVAIPALALGILALIRPPADIALIVFLQSAMPPVTAAPVLARRAGGDGAMVSQFLVGSFAFSLISIPAALAAFQFVSPAP
jgi:predicted permease